jgi:hypothetical protein
VGRHRVRLWRQGAYRAGSTGTPDDLVGAETGGATVPKGTVSGQKDRLGTDRYRFARERLGLGYWIIRIQPGAPERHGTQIRPGERLLGRVMEEVEPRGQWRAWTNPDGRLIGSYPTRRAAAEALEGHAG